jgi:hypothetical protein
MPEPTTWKTVPKGATEEMIEAGARFLRDCDLFLSPARARAIATRLWDAMQRAAPVPPKIEEKADE